MNSIWRRSLKAGLPGQAHQQARTVTDKQDIYRRDIAPKLGRKIIYDVTEGDLIKLVETKGKKARVRANRLAAELKVFFGWTASLRGLAVGLEVDPSRRLGDLRFPETPRSRRLALQEIAWFLEALAAEERDYQRGMLLWLLTAARSQRYARHARRSWSAESGPFRLLEPRTRWSTASPLAPGAGH
jgi:hypothetical protein